MTITTNRQWLLVDPTTRPVASEALERADRVGKLEGIRLGLLDNTKGNADMFLRELSEILNRRYGFSEVVMKRKESASKPAAADIVTAFSKEVDAVIAGIGD